MSALTSIPPPPVVGELQAIFQALHDRALLAKLKGPKRRGPYGYPPRVLWHCYVAYYVLGVESMAAFLRRLQDNPYIAEACGLSPTKIPSPPTMSRFISRLAKRQASLLVRNVHRELTRQLFDTFPNFGHTVAIDSTPMKGWSNGAKKGKRSTRAIRRRPRVGKPSDPDCNWHVKRNTHGKDQYVWGYKAHILCDADYELPIAVDITSGNTHDVRKAAPLLRQARYTQGSFYPKYVCADAAYSSERLQKAIRNQYHATPIIDPNPKHPKAQARRNRIPEWNAIFSKRTSVERINARLKGFYKLDSLRVRGRMKVRLHAFMSVLALQARALAFPDQARHCVRAVA